MKPLQENIQSDSMQSFRINHTHLPFLDSPWHYHADYELFYIIKSNGKRIIGDNIENFDEGDMIFMGPNLPHIWKNGEEYYQNSTNIEAEAIVIQFKEDAFGEGFFQLPEMQDINSMFKLARRGLKIEGLTHKIIANELLQILDFNSVNRFNSLLKILGILSTSSDLTSIATKSFERVYFDSGSDKINKVFEYVANNFRKDIHLDKIASVANMSRTAFCRYFKQKSLKTFTEYLNDIRISYACKLLIENKLRISQIAFECGFNSPMYFNRQFKKTKNMTPKEFCKSHYILNQNS